MYLLFPTTTTTTPTSVPSLCCWHTKVSIILPKMTAVLQKKRRLGQTRLKCRDRSLTLWLSCTETQICAADWQNVGWRVWRHGRPNEMRLDLMPVRREPVQLHIYDILHTYQHMDNDYNFWDSDYENVKLKKHKFICFFFSFFFFNTLVSPCGILSIYEFCCMPCPLLRMTLPALLPNGTVAELYIRGLSYSISDTPTLIPPSSETMAVGLIYTLNRMLNDSCVTSDGLTDIRSDTFSQVQEHEIYKDSRVGLPRVLCMLSDLVIVQRKKGHIQAFQWALRCGKSVGVWRRGTVKTTVLPANKETSFNELLINK